jgi:hypothetical protein
MLMMMILRSRGEEIYIRTAKWGRELLGNFLALEAN